MADAFLYAASASFLEDGIRYEAAYRLVSAERRRKTDRLRRAEDRRLSLCAELLLRYGLREAGVIPESGESPLPDPVYGPQGKPMLPNTGVCFSLSHSGEYAVCAVSGTEVGCDVERIGHADLSLAKRFFCSEESADVAARQTEEERNRTFFRYWTLKESYLKITGLGLKLPMNAFRIVLPRDDDPCGSTIAAVPTGAGEALLPPSDGARLRFAEFDDLPGCCCAVCSSEGEQFRLIRPAVEDLL